MARTVRVSSLGFPYVDVDPEAPISAVVDGMLSRIGSELDQVLPDEPDLVVMPEWCDVPKNYGPVQRERFLLERGDQILNFLCEAAQTHRCYITYPSLRRDGDGTVRNSMMMIDRSGEVVGTYDKNHPTVYEMKDDRVVAGGDIAVVECDFGRVGMLICFDLNFNELLRSYSESRLDVIAFSSMYHGGMMQQYWAYLCRSHFVSAIGSAYPSQMISPIGVVVAASSNYFDYVTCSVNLDCAVLHLDDNWDRLRAMKKKYGAKVTFVDPGYLGAVLVTSESVELGIDELVAEFGFELIDDYFARSLALQHASRRER